MSAPDEFAGHWVACVWNAADAQGNPHPDDAALLPSAGSCTALCVGHDGAYLILEIDTKQVRLLPFSVTRLPRAPQYSCGGRVRVRSASTNIDRAATVARLAWHFKDACYVYHLHGTSKRYAEHDLEPA